MKSLKPLQCQNSLVQDKLLSQRHFKPFLYALHRSSPPLKSILNRNSRIAKINFEIIYSSKAELEILKRNTKYLHTLNLDILTFRPSLEKLKKARSLKKIQISDDSYLSHRIRPFSCPKRDKQLEDIAKWIFRGRFFNLEYLGLKFISFEKMKKKYPYQLRKIPNISLTIDKNFSRQNFDENLIFQKRIISNAQLPSFFEKPACFRNLTHVRQHFARVLHEQSLFTQIFEQMSSSPCLTSLEISMVIAILNEKDLKLKKILEKFVNLTLSHGKLPL